MEPVTLGLILIALLLVLLFLKVWLGVAMAFTGLVGIALLTDFDMARKMVGIEPFAQMLQYTFSAVPLFILMGIIISNTGMGRNLFDMAAKFVGQVRGGLAIATVGACAVFSAVCGSSMATAVTMGKVAFPEMKRHNYDESMAIGAIAAGGSIGIMIPPSLAFILYGLITQESIGRLFMAGIVPGVMQAVFYAILITIMCKFNPKLGPAAPRATWKERASSLPQTVPIIILIILVLGGIYGGVFTATEAGAIGACCAIIIALAFRKLTKKGFVGSIREAASTTGMILILIVGAYVFMRFLTLSGLPSVLSGFANSLQDRRWVVLIFIIVLYLGLGCIMDIYSVIVLTLPITYPLMKALGYDMIWYGVLLVKLIELGEITPPVGINTYVLARTCKVRPETAFKGIIPFIISDLVIVAIICIWPELPMLLVNTSQAG
ncbi:MAG: TRAP transporter large permease [Clostridiales bacterium]|nr:TRAP transporter large permease [Clostridiales bacterium]